MGRHHSVHAARLAAILATSVGCTNAALAATCSCTADINLDGDVNGMDLTVILSNWGTANAAADVDNNGFVNAADITVVLANWGPCGAPVNDDCANAIEIGPGSYPFCTVNATTDGPDFVGGQCDGAPMCARDLWYVFSPKSDGVLKLDTCDCDYDSSLAVYGSVIAGDSPCPSAAPGLATLLACNDDVGGAWGSGGCFPVSSALVVDVKAGNYYRIRVGGYFDMDHGGGTLHVDFATEGASCADPILASTNYHQIFFGSTTDNAVDSSVPGNCYGGNAKGPMEWVKYTALCTGHLWVSTCNPGTDFDTVVTVLRWDFGANCWTTFVGCNDDSSETGDCSLDGLFRKSWLSVPTTAGDILKIVISGYGGGSGNFELTLDQMCN